MCVSGVVLRDMPSSGFALCRFSLTPRQMQEALTPGHLKKAKLMFFFTRYPSSTLLKTYFLDVQVKEQQPELGRAPWGTMRKELLLCPPALLAGDGGQHLFQHGLPRGRCTGLGQTWAVCSSLCAIEVFRLKHTMNVPSHCRPAGI